MNLSLFLQSQSFSSPIPGFLFLLSVGGAVMDYRYKKAGGRKPSKRDRILMMIATLLATGLIVGIDVGGNPGMAGAITPYLINSPVRCLGIRSLEDETGISADT